MNMKILKSIINFAKMMIPVCCLASCNYLNVVPPATADIPDLVKDEPTCLNWCLSDYEGIWRAYFYSEFETSVDEYVWPRKWGMQGSVVSWNQLGTTSESATASDRWDRFWDNIGKCNQFIQLLEKYRPADVTDGEMNRWISETIFLRAYYHFLLLEAYGPIPLMGHYYSENTPANEIPGRSHFDCCVDSIASWYDQAAKGLPATVDDNELGRATSVACKALKARLLLYAASPLWNGSFPYPNWKNKNYETPGYGEDLVSHTYDVKKWQRALDACNDAISLAIGKGERKLYDVTASEQHRENQNMPLPTIANADSSFRKHVMLMRYLNTTTEADGNHEIILQTYYDSFWYDPYHWTRMLPHGFVTVNGKSLPGQTSLSVPLSVIEHFYTNNGMLPENDPNFVPKSEWFQSAGISGRNDVINLCNFREPRFYAWLGYDGGEYASKLANGQPLILHMRDANTNGYNPSKYDVSSLTGFVEKKYIDPNLVWSTSDAQKPGNLRPIAVSVIRLGELYLDRAECYAALGDEDNALKDLNVIRERAGVPDLTDAMIKSSGMSLMDWVRNDRFVELYDEHQRYYDLRRWMIAPQLLKAGTREGLNADGVVNPTFDQFNRPVKIDQPFQWNDRMYLLPIESSEIYSNSQLVQAPGY